MINKDIIEQKIIDLEKKDTTYAVIERLSWLYTVRNNLNKAEYDNAMTEARSGNEFITACSNVPVNALIDILSEHFDAIHAVYPKEYYAILNKIKSLK